MEHYSSFGSLLKLILLKEKTKKGIKGDIVDLKEIKERIQFLSTQKQLVLNSSIIQ